MPFFDCDQGRLFFRERGSGPLLVILPGNTASSAHHEGELAHFGQRYHAVALDYLGTGQSDRLAEWPADWWRQNAHQVHALVRHLGAERALLVGTSGGAVVALWTAILYPDTVQAVIADSFVERQPPERLRAEVQNRRQRLPGQVDFWRAAHGDDWDAVVEADNRLLLRLADQDGRWFDSRLDTIACPVLLTASLGDDLIPDAGAQLLELGRRLPAGRVYFHHSGGHPLMWSQPDTFRRLADWFWQEVSA